MTGALYMLRIEIDGHLHGNGDVPKPWVARIDGPDPKFGLKREFIPAMNDWRDAHKAWSGNTYGVVATFPLRDGHVYETCRLRGRGRRRGLQRQFYRLQDMEMAELKPVEALAAAIGVDGSAATIDLDESEDTPPSVARIAGLGSVIRQGFVLVDGKRRYLLQADSIYLVREHEKPQRFLLATADGPRRITEKEAHEWLASKL